MQSTALGSFLMHLPGPRSTEPFTCSYSFMNMYISIHHQLLHFREPRLTVRSPESHLDIEQGAVWAMQVWTIALSAYTGSPFTSVRRVLSSIKCYCDEVNLEGDLGAAQTGLCQVGCEI